MEKQVARYNRFKYLRNLGLYAVGFGLFVMLLSLPLNDVTLVFGGLAYLIPGTVLVALGHFELRVSDRKIKAHRADENGQPPNPEDRWSR